MGNVSWDVRSLGAAARKVAGVVGLLAVAACCRPTPCSPPAFCGTPGPAPAAAKALPAPVPAEAGRDVEPPGAKFVRIKIINNTQKFVVKKNTTIYSFTHDTDGLQPWCNAVSPSGDQPFPKMVPPNSQLGVVADPIPYDEYACDPEDGPAFTMTLDIVHMSDPDKTRQIPVQCDASGFAVATVTLDQGTDPDDPAMLTAACSCN